MPRASPDVSCLFSAIILRDDADMTTGKYAAQAVHASRMSLVSMLLHNPDPQKMMQHFLDAGHIDTVAVLRAPLLKIMCLAQSAQDAGLPHYLFSDSGHAFNDIINGDEVVTGLGIGPAPRPTIAALTKKLKSL